MKRVAVLPTLVTLANGYCGVLAIYKIHDGRYYSAAGLVLLAMLFDLLDGKVARMAGLTSRFGAYIDSLSDAISFGVAPAAIVTAIVSPTALDSARTNEAITPDRAAGTTTLVDTSR